MRTAPAGGTVATVRALRIPALDALLGAAVLVASQIEVWVLGHGTAPPGLAAAAGLAAALGTALRRRAPLTGLMLVLAGLLALLPAQDISSDDDVYFPVFAAMFAVYSAGAHARRLRGLVAVLALVVTPVVFALSDPDGLTVDAVVFFEIFVGPPYLAGLAIAHRRKSELALTRHAERLDRDRERAAEAAVAQERTRIARELHDVVAHAVSVMVVQAQGGRRMVRQEPGEAEEAFDVVERTGVQALGEMRRLLGMLRSADERAALVPQPGLGHLEALVADVRGAGLPVELVLQGDPAGLPPGVDVSAYRIVQEALTNALKHAGPASATVRVRCLAGAVEVEVSDDGRGGGTDGGGHGLVGMRERVALYGGRLEAGDGPTGGFAIRARLPYEAR
jgi:signal transduction histidine kinase